MREVTRSGNMLLKSGTMHLFFANMRSNYCISYDVVIDAINLSHYHHKRWGGLFLVSVSSRMNGVSEVFI